MTSVPRYVLPEEVSDQRPLHIARHVYRRGEGFELHGHRFAELFWCETGAGRYRINGAEQDIRAGDLLVLRQRDVHACCAGDDGLTIVNVSFRAADLVGLARRVARERWPWNPDAELPPRCHCDPQQMERLHQWGVDLAAGAGALERDAFLLDIARLLARGSGPDEAAGLPVWLREGIALYTDARYIAGGTAELARICGRSQAHINRLVRAAQGRTAGQLVNRLRMDHAAAELRMSERSIATIAAACGLGNLGHFYREFHKVFGVTPHRYRQAAWQTARGRPQR